MSLDAIGLIARQEFLVALRARWVAGFSAAFSVLAIGIAYFGTTTAGVAGVQGFERTAASLLNLVLYLVPLLGLMLGTLAPDGSLAPLSAGGRPVQELPGTYELPALHRFLASCLDASAP